jgi:hypothetical protein
MTENDRRMLEPLERRKLAKDTQCKSCDVTGLYAGRMCSDSLGQGVLLTSAEYAWLMTVANRADDEILGVDVIE